MRYLPKRFRPKETIVEESKTIDSMRVYEITLLSSQKPKDFALKASKNEEKDIEMSYDITKSEFTYMAKRIKRIMKFNKRFYKNQ